MTRLAGAHVVVTGGSEGIGLATARLAAQRGARVSLIARRREVLEAAAASIDGDVAIAVADVGDAAQVAAALDAVTAEHGPCDVLVCCAGYALPGYVEELPIEEFERHMRVNYLGAVHAVAAVLGPMRQRRRGHVLLTSSTAGLIGVFGYAAYSPTKFAIRGFAEVLRAETVRDGIHVGVIYPPDTETPGFERENLTKPAETTAISGGIAPISAEAMATRIIAGIERNRFAIFADPATALLSRVSGLIGPVLRRVLDRTAAKAGAAGRNGRRA